MRSLVLLCVLVAVVIGVCKPARRSSARPLAAAAVSATNETVLTAPAPAAPQAPFLSLLNLGAALVGAVSSRPTAPYAGDATVALRLVERTAELEASVARLGHHDSAVQ